MSSSTIVESMAGHPEVGVLTPSDLEMELFELIADASYRIVQDDGHEHDQVAAFETFKTAGRNMLDDGEEAVTPDLGRVVRDFALGSTYKVLIVKGPKPHEASLPPTPSVYLAPHENRVLPVDAHRALLFGMAGWHPYGYTSQQPDNIWNNVIAFREASGVKGVSANADAALGLHTEDASYNKHGGVLHDGRVLDASYNLSPDVLSLHFLRNPLEIPTTVSTPDIAKLDDRIRQALTQPWFMNLTNPSQGGEQNDIPVPVSIVYGSDEPLIRANTDNLVVAETIDRRNRQLAQTALDAMLELLQDSTARLYSDPGDIVFIDNTRVLHGRSPYPSDASEEQLYGPASRWQRRVVGVMDRAQISPYETTRQIVDPQLLVKRIADLIAV